MKVIKPTKLGIVPRCFEADRRFFLSVGLMSLHRFGGSIASEMDMWPFLAEELGDDGVPDTGMPKRGSEVLVSGSGFAAGGEARPSCTVQLRIGAIEKELWVYGDRYWTVNALDAVVATEPEPFVQMPVNWKNAFGGPEFDRNPVGKGHAPVETAEGPVYPLPNVESPAQPVTSMQDRPEPAGLGPLDSTWPQRASKAGTYDAHWQEHLSPGFARDMDWSIFNLAPEDQQQTEPFRGDESFRVYGMHPEKPWVEGRLPRLRTRTFVTMRGTDEEALHEIGMELTTVWLFPHAERYLQVFHGWREVAEEDAADVLQLIVAAERLGEPRLVDHYAQVLARRLDPEKGALYALRDEELLPEMAPGEAEPDQAIGEMEALMATEGLLQANQRRRQEREIEAARERVAAMGLDPDVHGPPPLSPEEPPPTLDELPDVVERAEREAEQARAEAEERKAKMKEELRARLDAEGADADEVLRAMEEPPGGPPPFRAETEIRMLRARRDERRAVGLSPDPMDHMADDPEHHRQLEETEERLREMYRLGAHRQGAPPRLAGEAAAGLRAAALDDLARSGNLVRRNLTGFDLSGVDLSGIDLTGVWLENASLAGANLEGATLRGAVLARADLTDARLAGADLEGANLGGAELVRTRLDGARLGEAILGGARLEEASFRGASLAGADFMEIEVVSADLAEAKLPGVLFLDADLRGLSLPGAVLEEAMFVRADLRGVDLSGASLARATFLSVSAAGLRLQGADLENARFVEQCDLGGSDLRGATLDGANLRGTDLRESDFTGAELSGADLSESALDGAILERAVARNAMFTKAILAGARMASADLMNALLQRADLSGADLRGANLFGADLARVLADEATDFEGTNLKRARLHPRASPERGAG